MASSNKLLLCLIKLFHVGAFCQYVFAIYYDLNYVKAPASETHVIVQPGFGGRSRFLTYWCLVSKLIEKNSVIRKKTILLFMIGNLDHAKVDELTPN